MRGASYCHSLFRRRIRQPARSVPGTPRGGTRFPPLAGQPRGARTCITPRSARRYDAGMSEYSLDGLVSQFAIVLTAMTESEALLLDRVRQVRFEAQDSPAVSGRPRPSMPFPAADPADWVRSEPAPAVSEVTPAPSEMAPAWEDDTRNSRDGEPAPAWASSPSPADQPGPSPVGQPEFSQTEPGTPASGHRNYDYFSELDEKLTGLRQRYLE